MTIRESIVAANVARFKDKLDWKVLSSNRNITWDIIEANPNKPWDWSVLSYNPNITCDIIQANLDKPWNWTVLSWDKSPQENLIDIKAVTVTGTTQKTDAAMFRDFMQANPDKPWDWWWLSSSTKITWDIILTYPDKPWDWYRLSQNPNITMEIIKANPDKPWDWKLLTHTPARCTLRLIRNLFLTNLLRTCFALLAAVLCCGLHETTECHTVTTQHFPNLTPVRGTSGVLILKANLCCFQHMAPNKTTPELMQVCVDGWTNDIYNAIAALANIKSSIKARYFSRTQRDAINQSVIGLKHALHDPIFQVTRFTHQPSPLPCHTEGTTASA